MQVGRDEFDLVGGRLPEQAPAFLVDLSVMSSAEEDAVLERCVSPICPVLNVVAVAPIRRPIAMSKTTAFVTEVEGAAECRRNRPRISAHVERALVAIDRDQASTGIATEATRGLDRDDATEVQVSGIGGEPGHGFERGNDSQMRLLTAD